MPKKFIIKCKKCGGNVFWIDEGTGYKACIDKKTGILETYSCGYNEIEHIICSSCGEEYSENDFIGIEFCH